MIERTNGAGSVSLPPATTTTTTTTTSDASLLPPPGDAPDPGAAIAMLMVEEGFARRKGARADREAAEGALRIAQNEELARMEQKAEERYTAAKWDACGQIASGAVGVSGVAVSATSTPGSTWRAIGEGARASTDLVKGSTGLVSAGHRNEADHAETREKAADFAAQALRRTIDEAADDGRAARESIAKALELFQSYESARAQAAAAALYRA